MRSERRPVRTMSRRHLTVLATALAVLVAGCGQAATMSALP
jgi:hypothetical protein